MSKPHKYGAKAIVIDGHRFPSLAEARRYGELRLLERAGEIRGLILQPKFALHAFRAEATADVVVLIGYYIADFQYVEVASGELVTEDVKGMRTELYEWKKRHVEAQYGITVREIGRRR